MRLIPGVFIALLFFSTFILTVSAQWDKDDQEIFKLQNDLENDEGKGANFYSILNLTRGATAVEIRKAYRARSIELHPDKHPSNPHAARRFERLGVINKILRDERRDRYDHFLINGFPKWRGTGYFYSRFRPSLPMVVLFLIGVTSGIQLVIKNLNWKRDIKRLRVLKSSARLFAWGPRFRYFEHQLSKGDKLEFTVVHNTKRVRVPLAGLELPPLPPKKTEASGDDDKIDWDEDERNVRRALAKGTNALIGSEAGSGGAGGSKHIDAKVDIDGVYVCEPGTRDSWIFLDEEKVAPKPGWKDTWALATVVGLLARVKSSNKIEEDIVKNEINGFKGGSDEPVASGSAKKRKNVGKKK